MTEGVPRVPWPERIMQLAGWWAQWSTCRWLQVGAVVVDDDFQVLVSGINGPARGQPHCNEVDQPREAHQLTCLHAEINCILQAARIGVSLRGASMYTWYRPCIRCAPHLVQVGLRAVYWRNQYGTDGLEAEAVALMKVGGIRVLRI
jgi:dCMP deaminase